MHTAEETESMQRHPTADAAGVPEAEPVDPYTRHFVAIEELKDAIALFGPQSSEAMVARMHVDASRNAAIAAWRQERAAA